MFVTIHKDMVGAIRRYKHSKEIIISMFVEQTYLCTSTVKRS